MTIRAQTGDPTPILLPATATEREHIGARNGAAATVDEKCGTQAPCPPPATGRTLAHTRHIIELPLGIHQYKTFAFANTWEAWDLLTGEDGWEERSWPVHGETSIRRHIQREAEINGHRLVVFPPEHSRASETYPPSNGETK